MKAAGFLTLVVAVVLVPVALAANGQPQKKITKADQARARAISIRAADLGAGWTAQVDKSKNQSNPRCSNYNPDQSDLIETGDYDSPDFSLKDGTFVSSTTGVFKTQRMAQTGYARVAVPQLPGCFGQIFKKGAAPAKVTILTAGPLSFPHLGDRSNAYRVTATVTAQGTKVPVAIDLVAFNKGRADVAMIFLGITKPLPAAFEQALAARVAARAQ